jgi:drug/metabolite transporter (DMT)-like permease
MEPLAAAAVLAASLLHAAWHALVKSSGDQVVALAGMNLVSGAVALALAPLTGPLPRIAYAVIAGSVLLHVGYKLALARLYLRSDLGQAYPLARGVTPVMAVVLAFIALGELPAPLVLGGIGLVCAGIASLAFERRGITAGQLATAAAAGLAVAAYSVVDAYGIRLSGDWFSFTVWLVLLDSAAFVCYALATRRAVAVRTWRSGWGRVLVSGCLGVGAFGVFMWALGRAPVGPVTALRETSVLFAAIIGAVVLGERATWKRYAAAVAVMAGISVIALGK